MADSTAFDPLQSFDHVVVLMLENRSFDNLLGFLYKPEDILPSFPLGKKYAGLYFDGPHTNPVPTDSGDEYAGKEIPVTVASDYFQPFPDPGEFYPHVNTQLFNIINPPGNKGKPDNKIVAPYNLPSSHSPYNAVCKPPMTGFVKDYISVLRSLNNPGCLGRILNWIGVNPKGFKLSDKYRNYKSIMECFTPQQIPVMTTLAKEFAVFDHWHCDVPSQTYTNRVFWHCGTSSGLVNNSPMLNWFEHNDSPTLFNLMEAQKLPWKIYTDNIVAFTALLHTKQLADFFGDDKFKSFTHFLEDAKNGSLPAYSFIEPRFFTPHNDQHPSSYDSLLYGPSSVGSVFLGEKLIYDVYNAIKNSKNEAGSNWKNTLLIITHDEHGGCFDHIPPPCAPSPTDPPKAGQDGFKFDRLGVRVPMIMISAHIKPNTIVNEMHHHTSFLHTMCEKWGLKSLTNRDKNAPKFHAVFTSPGLRDISTWPELLEPVIPQGWHELEYENTELNGLERYILQGVSQWKTGSTTAADRLKTVEDALKFLSQLHDLPGAEPEKLTHHWQKKVALRYKR